MKNEKLLEIFKRYYPNVKEENISSSFCPYRVCPVGAHIDHQKGNVTGFAIDKGITCLYAKTSSHLFEAASLNFPGKKGGSVVNISAPQNDWADYLRGTAKLLNEKYDIEEGIYCLLDGELPIGGISSSAAVIIAFATSLCKANEIELSDEEMIHLVQEVENKYIGVNSGLLDQSCETLSKKDHLLYLDINNNTHKLIKKSEKMSPYEIAIIFSGVKRTLVGSQYNTRVDELKSASYCLKAFSRMEYGKYQDSVLRDVPKDIYLEYKHQLPENFRRRAEHYYSEMDRVERGVKAWQQGNLVEFGKISTESGNSSIENYEAGSKELIEIHNIMKQTDGIYGGRFSGAGFKGCCLALIDPSYEESIKEEITRKYLEVFPEYKSSFGIYYCNTSDGVNLGKVKVKK